MLMKRCRRVSAWLLTGLLLVSLPEKLPSLCANALQITLAE